MIDNENDTQWELAAWETLAEAKEQLTSERALADRLAEALTNPATYIAMEALDAWKEARSD